MKTVSITERFKSDIEFRREYLKINYWIKSRFGSASVCENVACKTGDEKVKFFWVLKHGRNYEKVKENFMQLCFHCHLAYFKNPHHAIGTRIYGMWQNMLNRCRNPKVDSYKHYGAKGITVCERWNEFENFYSDMIEGYADNLSLDRKENDKGYYKENCRWVTMKVQQSNRTNNFWIESDGEKKILIDWARELNISQGKLSLYIKDGYSIEDVKQYLVRKNHKSESIKNVLKRIA